MREQKRIRALALLGFLPVASECAAQTLQAINPGLVQSAPVPSTCPAGRHWTTLGSGIAHCVADDPVCPGTTELTHDALGNPSCFVPIVVEEDRETGCTGGKVGTRYQVRNRITHADGSVTYSTWKTVSSDCTAPPPPPPSEPPPSSPPPVSPPPVNPPPVNPPPVNPPPVNPPPVNPPPVNPPPVNPPPVNPPPVNPPPVNPPPVSCPAPSIACSFTQGNVVGWTVTEVSWVPYGNTCKAVSTVIAKYFMDAGDTPSEC